MRRFCAGDVLRTAPAAASPGSPAEELQQNSQEAEHGL
jgi:hypothetical protein